MTSGTRVSDSKIWKCPTCGSIMVKSSWETAFRPGDPLPENYQGTSTCGKCGSIYDWRDVYGGLYDPTEKVRTADPKQDVPKLISVVAFLLGARTPPADVRKYAHRILEQRYPSSQLHKEYLIGRSDDNMTETEALILYNDYVRTADLPDLGEQFDASVGRGSDGTKVVVLYFRPRL